MKTEDITVHSGQKLVVDVTGEVERFCEGLGDGLCHIFLPHATAGLALMEVGSRSEADLSSVLDEVLPPGDRYQHRHGSRGHGRDHLVPAFISPSLVLAVRGGRPVLGTWQSVVMVDTNIDNPERHLVLSYLPATP